jgi:hypothetical protein
VLLRVGTTPDHPAWRSAVSRLGDLDDGFAIEAWKETEAKLLPDAKAFVDEAVGRIRALTGGDDAAFAHRVAGMLARAAWVDLSCSPFEVTFVEWTMKTIRSRLGSPDVRSAVGGAASKMRDPHVRARVAEYADSLRAP